MNTKATQRERIQNLENELRQLKSQVSSLLQPRGRQGPSQPIRIIESDFTNSTAQNKNCSFVDLEFDNGGNPTIKQRTTQPNGHRCYRLTGHRFNRDERPKVAFWYRGNWYEMPPTYGAAVFKTTYGDIPGRADDIPGHNSAIRMKLENGVLVPHSSLPETIHNLATEKIEGQTYIQAKLDIEGNWWCDFEDCSV